MRIARISSCLGIALLAALSVIASGDQRSTTAVADSVGPRPSLLDRTHPGFRPYVESEIEHSLPDASTSVIAGTTGTDEECQTVGGFSTVFSPITNVFRGNRFEPAESVTIFEFGYRLDVGSAQDFDLFFSIHEAPTGTLPFTRTMDDVIIQFDEAKLSEIYTTGTIDPPITLEVGKEYILGVSWGQVAIRYGRATTPSIGSEIPALNDALYTARYAFDLLGGEPPLDPLDLGIFPFPSMTSGPWQMTLCRTAACCLPNDDCTELGNLACQVALGGYSAPGVTCDAIADENLGCPLTVASCCNNDICAEETKFECEGDGGEWNPQVPFCSDDPV